MLSISFWVETASSDYKNKTVTIQRLYIQHNLLLFLVENLKDCKQPSLSQELLECSPVCPNSARFLSSWNMHRMFFLSLSCSLLSETCFISAAISFSSLSKSMATTGRTEAEEKAWPYLIADIIFAPVKHIKCYCESKIYKCVSFLCPTF